LPAFPGAEGFGASATGGRGGRVIKVTNLQAKGPGSLQAACETEGPRIVVFDVSGVIRGDIRIKHGRVTIAGQTAHGAGITIDGHLSCEGIGYGKPPEERKPVRDVVVRFLRVRPTRGGGDCVGFTIAENVVLDHLSVAWGGDENLGLNGTGPVTVQWCAVEESQVVWEGATFNGLLHNYGMILGYTAAPASLHHNLFAHHYLRAPLAGQEVLDYRNNVVYNMIEGLQWHPRRFNLTRRGRRFRSNVVGNYYKAGPGAPHFVGGALPLKYGRPGVRCALPKISTKNSEMYADGNFLSYLGGYVDLWQVGRQSGRRAAGPWSVPPVTTHTAERAYDLVLAHAGCLPRDAVGRRTIREVRTGAGSWGRLAPQGGLMEGLTPGRPPKDIDADGMPDAWETDHGLDPADSRDATRIVPAGASKGDRHKGYTYVEYYVNERADQLIAEAVAGAERDNADGAHRPVKPWKLSEIPEPSRMTKVDIPAQIKILRDKDAKRRPHAAKYLGAARAVEAIPALMDALGESDRYVLRYVIQALALMGERSLPRLREALADADPLRRSAAAQTIALIAPKNEAINAALVGLMGDRDPRIRAAAAWALNRIGPWAPEHLAAFVKAMDDKDWVVRCLSAEAIGKMGPAAGGAVGALIRGLTDSETSLVRYPSAWALGQVGAKAAAAVDPLVAALGDSDPRLRWHAARTLVGLGPKGGEALTRALGNQSPTVRREAAAALARLGLWHKALASLARAVKDEDPGVCLAAASALASVDPKSPRAAAALVEALSDEAWPVRWRAVKSLGELGLADREVLDALQKACSDTRREVNEAAAVALRELSKPKQPGGTPASP
jgi:HEAT repeat protein